MLISFRGDRRYIKGHVLLDRDISATEPGPEEEWGDGDLHIRAEGSEVLVGWNALGFGLEGTYRCTLKLTNKEIARLVTLALRTT